VKIVGFVVAIWLIVFGSVENVWRTIKFAFERMVKG